MYRNTYVCIYRDSYMVPLLPRESNAKRVTWGPGIMILKDPLVNIYKKKCQI